MSVVRGNYNTIKVILKYLMNVIIERKQSSE